MMKELIQSVVVIIALVVSVIVFSNNMNKLFNMFFSIIKALYKVVINKNNSTKIHFASSLLIGLQIIVLIINCYLFTTLLGLFYRSFGLMDLKQILISAVIKMILILATLFVNYICVKWYFNKVNGKQINFGELFSKDRKEF